MARAKKPTKKALEECFAGVPNYLYRITKSAETGELLLEASPALAKNHSAALERMNERFCYVFTPADTSYHPDKYIIQSVRTD